MKDDKKKEKERLQDEFEQIQSEFSGEYALSDHLASVDDLPDLGQIEIYDYDSDLNDSRAHSFEMLETLVDLFLNDLPKLKEHPYIKNKMKEDAMVYAEALFLTKMTRKNFLNQLKQVDNGDNSARMHEVVNQTIGQIRENSKFLLGQRSELEKFYKNLRNDLGYDVTPEINEEFNDDIDDVDATNNVSEDGGIVTDNRDLNEKIRNAMMSQQK
jgi:hypothetical protein